MDAPADTRTEDVRLDYDGDGEFVVFYKDQPLALIVIPAAATRPGDGYWTEQSPAWNGPLDHVAADEFLIGAWADSGDDFERLFKDKLTGEGC